MGASDSVRGQAGQPERKDGEGQKDGHMNGVRHKEGHDASEDGYHGHVGHALDDEKIQSHGGVISPISVTRTTRMPNHIGLMPYASMSG